MGWPVTTIVRRRKKHVRVASRSRPRGVVEAYNPRQARDAHGRWTVSGMSPAVAATIVPFERRVAGEEHARNPRPGYGTMFGPERGMIVDGDGEVLWSGTGEATRIEGPGLSALRPGVTMTHFHPSAHERAHLSTGDMETALSTGATIRAFNANGAWQQFTPNKAGQHLGISLQDLYPHMKEVGGDMEDALSTVLKDMTSSKGTWQEGSHSIAEADTNEFGGQVDPGSSYSDEFRTRIIRGSNRGKAIIDARAAEENLYRLTTEQTAELKALVEQARKDTIEALSKATKDWLISDRRAVLAQLDTILTRFEAQASLGLQKVQTAGWEAGANLVTASGVAVSTLPHLDPAALSIALSTSPDLITNVTDEVRGKVATMIRLAALAQRSPLDVMKEIGSVTGKGVFANAFARGEAIYRTEAGRMLSTANYARQRQLEERDPGWMKEWHAVLDLRTRLDHAKANGQRVKMNGLFVVGGYTALYPHDPELPARESVHCRCISIAVRPEWEYLAPGKGAINDVTRSYGDLKARIDRANTTYWDAFIRSLTDPANASKPHWSRSNTALTEARMAVDRDGLIRQYLDEFDRMLADYTKAMKGLSDDEIKAAIADLRALRTKIMAEADTIRAKGQADNPLPTGASIGSPEWEIAWARQQRTGGMASALQMLGGRIEAAAGKLTVNLPIAERVLPRPTKESFGSGGKKLAEVQRAYDDALAIARALEDLGFRTSWTGKITYGGAGRSAATFGWDGTINVNASTYGYTEANFRKVLLHELLHGVSGASSSTYRTWPGWEEGVVERASQVLEPQVRAKAGLDAGAIGYNTYARYTKALHTLWSYANGATGISEYDFILTLLRTPLGDRAAWVGTLIDEKTLPSSVLLLIRDAGNILRRKA